MSTLQVQDKVTDATKITIQNVESLDNYWNLLSPEVSKLRERLQDISRVKEKIVDASNLHPELFNSQIEALVELDELMSQTIDDYWSEIPDEILNELETRAYPLLNPEAYLGISDFVGKNLFDKFIKTRRKYVKSVLAAAKLNESQLKNSDFNLRDQSDAFQSRAEEKLYIPSNFSDLYETDFYAWTQEQSKLLQNKFWDSLDVPNLVEEIESLGRQERRELTNSLGILLGHLLKWEFQIDSRSKSWFSTIREQRKQIDRLFKDSPSIKPYLPEALQRAYEDGLELAVRETSLGYGSFPKECPYELEQVLDISFFPGLETELDFE